jgi:outer membrane receptor protein involved in Fe transport
MDGDTARAKEDDGDQGWLPTWGAALKKDLGEAWTLRTSYGTFNRFPNLYEMFGDGAYIYPSVLQEYNSDKVTREHGWQWDAGVDWRGEPLGVKTKATVNYFNRLVHDSIMLIERRDVARYVNNQSVKFEGLEFENRLEYGPLAFDFSATWQTFKDAGQNKNRQYPFYVQLPGKMFNARLSYNFCDGRVTVFGEENYTGKVDYMSDINDEKPLYMEQMRVFNAGLKWSVTDNMKLTIGGNDLTNEGPKQRLYPSSSETLGGDAYKHAIVPYPQQGRTWYSTVEYTF